MLVNALAWRASRRCHATLDLGRDIAVPVVSQKDDAKRGEGKGAAAQCYIGYGSHLFCLSRRFFIHASRDLNGGVAAGKLLPSFGKLSEKPLYTNTPQYVLCIPSHV